MTDKASSLAETSREVGRRRIGAGEARTALIRRRYDASIEDVWKPVPIPTGWGAGSSSRRATSAAARSAWRATPGGEILRCEPPRLLRVTWAYGDMPVDEVELRLFPGEKGGHPAGA